MKYVDESVQRMLHKCCCFSMVCHNCLRLKVMLRSQFEMQSSMNLSCTTQQAIPTLLSLSTNRCQVFFETSYHTMEHGFVLRGQMMDIVCKLCKRGLRSRCTPSFFSLFPLEISHLQSDTVQSALTNDPCLPSVRGAAWCVYRSWKFLACGWGAQ